MDLREQRWTLDRNFAPMIEGWASGPILTVNVLQQSKIVTVTAYHHCHLPGVVSHFNSIHKNDEVAALHYSFVLPLGEYD